MLQETSKQKWWNLFCDQIGAHGTGSQSRWKRKTLAECLRCCHSAKTKQVRSQRAETPQQGSMLARHYIHVLCHANAYNPSRKQPHSETINVQTHVRYRC